MNTIKIFKGKILGDVTWFSEYWPTKDAIQQQNICFWRILSRVVKISKMLTQKKQWELGTTVRTAAWNSEKCRKVKRPRVR